VVAELSRRASHPVAIAAGVLTGALLWLVVATVTGSVANLEGGGHPTPFSIGTSLTVGAVGVLPASLSWFDPIGYWGSVHTMAIPSGLLASYGDLGFAAAVVAGIYSAGFVGWWVLRRFKRAGA
jgi:hypothetical protein